MKKCRKCGHYFSSGEVCPVCESREIRHEDEDDDVSMGGIIGGVLGGFFDGGGGSIGGGDIGGGFSGGGGESGGGGASGSW